MKQLYKTKASCSKSDREQKHHNHGCYKIVLLYN